MVAHPPRTVEEVVDSCLVYWLLAGVSRQQADAMAMELRSHLEQAVAAGKSTEDVVGEDIARFAEEWRRAVWKPRPLWATLLDMAHLVAAAILITLLPSLILWRPTWTLEVAHLVQMAWLAAGLFVLFSPRWGGRWLANSEDRTQARRWLAVLLATFVGNLLLSPSLPLMPAWPVVQVHQWHGWVVAAVCLAINGLAIALDPTRPRRSQR